MIITPKGHGGGGRGWWNLGVVGARLEEIRHRRQRGSDGVVKEGRGPMKIPRTTKRTGYGTWGGGYEIDACVYVDRT